MLEVQDFLVKNFLNNNLSLSAKKDLIMNNSFTVSEYSQLGSSKLLYSKQVVVSKLFDDNCFANLLHKAAV